MKRSDNSTSVIRAFATTLLLAVVIFILALVTRPLAWMYPEIYGLHAALCAPCYALMTALAVRRTGRVLELIGAFGIIAIILGSMKALQMGLPFVLITLFIGLVGVMTPRRSRAQMVGSAAVVSLPFYVLTVAVGYLFGTFGASATAWGFMTAVAVLSMAVSGLVLLFVHSTIARTTDQES